MKIDITKQQGRDEFNDKYPHLQVRVNTDGDLTMESLNGKDYAFEFDYEGCLLAVQEVTAEC